MRRVTRRGLLANFHAPQVWPGLQVAPLDLAGGAALQLHVQGHRIVVVDDDEGLAHVLGVKAREDLRVTLVGGDGAHVDFSQGSVHGNNLSTEENKQEKTQPSLPSSRVRVSQGV